MKVAVVFGGPSAEAEVSRVSAAAVRAGLVEAGHDALEVELDVRLPARLLQGGFDVAFPVAHGALGEDGCLQGLLEVLGLPYVGSGVLSSALSADKVESKRLYAAHGLPVARHVVVSRGEPVTWDELRTTLGARVVIKPARGGSALGVTRLAGEVGEEALAEALRSAQVGPGVALVEELIEGLELTCGVLETDQGPIPLPATQISAKAADFYDFRSKYAAGGSQHVTPAPLDEGLARRVGELAVGAHLALGNRDLSRTDMILQDGATPILLETNTLPGMTGVSLFPEAAGVAGYSLPALCDYLVWRAASRRQDPATRLAGVALPAPFA